MPVSDFHILFPHLGKFLHTQQRASIRQFPIFLCQTPADCLLPLPYKIFRFLIISVLFVSNRPLLTRSPSRFYLQRIIWLIRFAGFTQKENIALPRLNPFKIDVAPMQAMPKYVSFTYDVLNSVRSNNHVIFISIFVLLFDLLTDFINVRILFQYFSRLQGNLLAS